MQSRPGLTSILLFIIVAALAYLPLIDRVGYSHDDWYLMAAAQAEGPGVFHQIFSVDRPLRAWVMIPAYMLFGGNSLYYHLSAYFFRVLGALALLWILRMLWQRQHIATLQMALMFLIYPGFLSQPNAIDYQSHIAGLAAALFSVALTIQGILSKNLALKILLHASSVLLGWFYLGQMEWYIGIEFFRWGCVYLLSARPTGTIVQNLRRTFRWGYPSLAAPVGFLMWRFLFFENERGATDVGIQLGQLKLYPLQTVYHWAVQVIQDLFDVMLSAWVIPLFQLAGYIQGWGILLTVVLSGLILFVIQKINIVDSQDESLQLNFQREAFAIGLFVAICGLIPIAMANREVSFPSFSRYALISSIGVPIFVVTLLMGLKSKLMRNGIATGLCVISILTHHANTVKYAHETAATNMFWWQVSWRVPQFEKNTTLIANYSGAVIEEDYFIWGPANLIYYPEKQNPKVVQPGLYAAVLNKDTVHKVLTRERQEFDNRKNIITYKNYRNIVILTQPTSRSCVHVIDGNHPEYAPSELDSIRTIEPYSEIEHVLADETLHAPPTVTFGSEPPRHWCYYYEKADLARQRGNWDEAKSIGEEAFGRGLKPEDAIEWMPFLQAYMMDGDVERLTELAPVITTDPFIARQACQLPGLMQGLSNNVVQVVDSLYCIQ
jgi:hypothetical protein